MIFLCKQPKEKYFWELRIKTVFCSWCDPHMFLLEPGVPAIVSSSPEQLKDTGESVEVVEFYKLYSSHM